MFCHKIHIARISISLLHLLSQLLIPSGGRGISQFIKMPVQCISAKYDGTGIESPVCLRFHFTTKPLGKTEHIYFIYLVSPHLHLPSSFQVGHERALQSFPRCFQLFLLGPGAGIQPLPLLWEGGGGCRCSAGVGLSLPGDRRCHCHGRQGCALFTYLWCHLGDSKQQDREEKEGVGGGWSFG